MPCVAGDVVRQPRVGHSPEGEVWTSEVSVDLCVQAEISVVRSNSHEKIILWRMGFFLNKNS